jgi:hypothetical protein
MLRFGTAVLIVGLSAGVTATAERHRFTPTHFYTTFSAAHPPALRINPATVW